MDRNLWTIQYATLKAILGSSNHHLIVRATLTLLQNVLFRKFEEQILKFLSYIVVTSVGWLYSSAVERCTCNAAAPGSNPGGALRFILRDNPELNLAQPSLI